MHFYFELPNYCLKLMAHCFLAELSSIDLEFAREEE